MINNPTDPAGAIATHAALATVHQNAPGLISSHAGIPTAHHASIVEQAEGDYTGNGAAGRQISTGFKCALVIVVCEETVDTTHFLIQDAKASYIAASCVIGANNPTFHATDGFVTGTNGGVMNENAKVYYWRAISE